VAGKKHFAPVFPHATLNGGAGGRLCCKCTLFCYFVQSVLSLIVGWEFLSYWSHLWRNMHIHINPRWRKSPLLSDNILHEPSTISGVTESPKAIPVQFLSGTPSRGGRKKIVWNIFIEEMGSKNFFRTMTIKKNSHKKFPPSMSTEKDISLIPVFGRHPLQILWLNFSDRCFAHNCWF
jgi:hypothetical protein